MQSTIGDLMIGLEKKFVKFSRAMAHRIDRLCRCLVHNHQMGQQLKQYQPQDRS